MRAGAKRRSLGEHVVHAAAIAARCSPEAITGPTRVAGIVRVRDCAMWSLRQAGWSLPAIGRLFGGRDHSTVRAAIARAESRREAARGGKAEECRQ